MPSRYSLPAGLVRAKVGVSGWAGESGFFSADAVRVVSMTSAATRSSRIDVGLRVSRDIWREDFRLGGSGLVSIDCWLEVGLLIQLSQLSLLLLRLSLLLELSGAGGDKAPGDEAPGEKALRDKPLRDIELREFRDTDRK